MPTRRPGASMRTAVEMSLSFFMGRGSDAGVHPMSQRRALSGWMYRRTRRNKSGFADIKSTRSLSEPSSSGDHRAVSEALIAEFAAHLGDVARRHAGSPRTELDELWRIGLEREAIVTVAYRHDRIGQRL